MVVEQLIGQLLWRHNCVVVPGFGGFVASRQPAQLDTRNGMLLAPSKQVLFNRLLVNNDGLLNQSLANELQISYDEAADHIATTIENWREKLMLGSRIQLDLVGSLYLDQEQNVCFDQDRYHNLLMDAYGMGQVRFVAEQVIETPVAVETVQKSIQETAANEEAFVPVLSDEETPAFAEIIPFITEQQVSAVPNKKQIQKAVAKQKSPIVVLRPVSVRKAIRYVAAACLLPIAFYTIWIPMKTDVLQSGVISWQDFNPFQQKDQATTVNTKTLVPSDQTEATDVERLVALEDETLAVHNEESVESEITSTEEITEPISKEETPLTKKPAITPPKKEEKRIETPKTISSASITSGKLQLIVGSFSNQHNADALVQELKIKGFGAYFIKQENGLFRVSAGRYADMEAAKGAMNALSGIGRDSWILK